MKIKGSLSYSLHLSETSDKGLSWIKLETCNSFQLHQSIYAVCYSQILNKMASWTGRILDQGDLSG